jgi:hypothetical protein
MLANVIAIATAIPTTSCMMVLGMIASIRGMVAIYGHRRSTDVMAITKFRIILGGTER